MARKYSLKDNPIFQGLQVPKPPSEPPPTPEAPEALAEALPQFEGQNLTLKNRPSEFYPLNDKLNEPSESALQPTSEVPLEHVVEAAAEVDAQQPLPKNAEAFNLQDNIDRALFFGFYNEVADILLPTLDVSCQVLYNRLFRLSYGFNRNYCTVSQPILMEKTGLSRNTVRTGLQSLTKEGWLRIIESGNRISTTYRIVLPREQNESISIRASNLDPQNMRVKIRGSKSGGPEGQNLGVQNMTLKTKNLDKQLDLEELNLRVSNFEGQKLTPLLYLTNRSLTLSKERESDPQNLKPEELKAYGEKLVDKFYMRLGLRVSKTKKEQSVQACLTLFDDGFTPEEIDYAISWLIERHPETGTFNRVLHFIDQAVKDRQAKLQTATDKEQLQAEATQQAQVKSQEDADREQVIALLSTLSEAVRKQLEQQAAQFVQKEHGDVKHGREILIRLKVEELVRDQYFAP